MIFLAVTKLIPTPEGLLVAVDYFDVTTMQMIVGYTDVSFEKTMNDFMSDMGLVMAIVLPVTREQFREICTQTVVGVDNIIDVQPSWFNSPEPSRN